MSKALSNTVDGMLVVLAISWILYPLRCKPQRLITTMCGREVSSMQPTNGSQMATAMWLGPEAKTWCGSYYVNPTISWTTQVFLFGAWRGLSSAGFSPERNEDFISHKSGGFFKALETSNNYTILSSGGIPH